MKKFSEMGIKVGGGSGKMFDCEQVAISSIVNIEVAVLDYAPGVKTKHGEDRYVVHFKNGDKEGKFFTTAKNITDALDQIEEFPFETTIRSVKCAKGITYQLT
jgi:hypothetical protein